MSSSMDKVWGPRLNDQDLPSLLTNSTVPMISQQCVRIKLEHIITIAIITMSPPSLEVVKYIEDPRHQVSTITGINTTGVPAL